ncbi:MAG: hypothetical protein P8L85_04560 [Rubripirellula sp.]|nr:hypothetical protein [Rubripirellula sp.]
MHKEVIRPLMLWPAVVSVTITTAAWLAQVGIDLGGPINRSSAYFPTFKMDELLVQDNVDSAVPMSDRKLVELEPSPTLLAEAQARTEHGTRAMQLPNRVATAYGVETGPIFAPVLDEQREMAGWVSPTVPIALNDAEEMALDGPHAASESPATQNETIRVVDNVVDTALKNAPNPIAEAVVNEILAIAPDISVEPVIDETVEPNADIVIAPAVEAVAVKAVDTASDRQPSPTIRSGISRSEPAFPSNIAIDGLDLAPSPRLPKSTRYLAKPAPQEAATAAANNSVSLVLIPNEADRDTDPTLAEPQTADIETIPAISNLEFSPPVEPPLPTNLRRSSSPKQAQNPESQPQQPSGETPAVKDEQKKPSVSPPKNETTFAGWPSTNVLDEQLASLIAHPSSEAQQWALVVADSLAELQSLSRLGEPQAGILIDRLNQVARNGLKQAEQVADRNLQIEWLLASHAIARRVAIWKPIWQLVQPKSRVIDQPNQTDQAVESTVPLSDTPPGLASKQFTTVKQVAAEQWLAVDDQPTLSTLSASEQASEAARLTALIHQLRTDVAETGDGSAWSDFLLLDEIEQAAQHAKSRDRVVLAQRVLSRLKWHGLDREQERWLDRDSVEQLVSVISPWARGAVDYANLLRQLERQEADTIDLAAIEIANSVQSLRFATSPEVVTIGEEINTYYRNANVRLALSQTLLQRMMPTIDPQTVPLQTIILGSRVRGTSQLESDLRLQLSPSPNRWRFDLQAIGNVQTNSTGVQNGVAVQTHGNSNFQASTLIEINTQGIDVGSSEVKVQGRSSLRGIRSDYDGWPVVGSLVRTIAKRRYESVQPQTNRIAAQKIKAEVSKELQQRVDERVSLATQQLSEMVLGPLGRLQLNPKVMDLQTTDTRLLARYRLAGDWQLAAFTPRPRAPSSSLMSLQIHQSALNNTFEQLIPRDQPLTIQELIRHSAVTFGQNDITLPEDIPSNVRVQFAKTRPVTVEIEDGQLWITLRVLHLRRDDRKGLTRFIVRAAYRPQVDGINAALVRDGHLRISGPGMSARERLPIRAIFNKVLASSRSMPLTLPQVANHPAMDGLEISQVELRDGWIAIAISEQGEYKIALRGQEPSMNRK